MTAAEPDGTSQRRFAQVDVFGSGLVTGNPVAVVVDGDGLSESQLRAFARWTNLSETTFLFPPTTTDADYRVRIFTPTAELPFAGHPTLGSAKAWLASGGTPRHEGVVVQECGVGLITLHDNGGRLSFAAPELLRDGEIDEATLDRVTAALGVRREAILRHQWVDNGPGWLAVELATAEAVLALEPDFAVMGELKVGVFGWHPAGAPTLYEVRAFVPGLGIAEDPVTGSLNAGLAIWLLREGLVPDAYAVRQGTALGRDGRVLVTRDSDGVWIGGSTEIVIAGNVRL